MSDIYFEPPRLEGNSLYLRWRVEPASELYLRQDCRFDFPADLDLSVVPPRAWWWLALMVHHLHWPLLRPCRVHLPVRLGEQEIAFWRRLVETGITTLDAYRGVDETGGVEIIDGTEPLPDTLPLRLAARYATAFSGGKDSLLQTGLLAELTERPLLVTVTSPLPPMEDHLSPRRREILAAMAARTDVEHVEVWSDVRSSWNNQWPRSIGYKNSVNELSDTLAYLGALAIVAMAKGAGRALLASEVEVNTNTTIDGRFLQHPHFMYSVVTLGALDRLFAQAGIRIGSLTPPLYSSQVQELLWRRYPELQSLQFSCWRVTGSEQVCNDCSQCLRIGFLGLANGHRPSRMGIDIAKLLEKQDGWRPRPRPAAGALPEQLTAIAHHGASVDAIRRVSAGRLVREVLSRPGKRWQVMDAVRSVRRHRAMKAALADYEATPPTGYRRLMLEFVDPQLRDRVDAIYGTCFSEEPAERYADQVANARARIEWITGPLSR